MLAAAIAEGAGVEAAVGDAHREGGGARASKICGAQSTGKGIWEEGTTQTKAQRQSGAQARELACQDLG